MLASGGALSPAAFDIVAGGPLDLLAAWVQNPDPDTLSALAMWTPAFLASADNQVQLDATEDLGQVALRVLDDQPLGSGDSDGWVWRYGAAVLVARVDDADTTAVSAALVLDDRPAALTGGTHPKAWREWLRLANLLNLRPATRIEAVTNLHAAPPLAQPTLATSPIETLTAGWYQAMELATAEERPLLLAYAAAGLPVPDVGEETDSGLPLAIAWKDQQGVVDIVLEPGDRIELENTGWHVAAPDVNAVRAALTAREG
jgi:hypothetical protein